MTPLLYIGALLAVFLIGLIFVFTTLDYRKWLNYLLAGSGSFIVSIAFLHVLPELFQENQASISYYILLGFGIQIFLEFFSKGIEHGHAHLEKHPQFPWSLFLALCIHAFIEGMPIASYLTSANANLDGPLFTGIILHKFPVIIVLASLLRANEIPKGTAIIALAVFCLSTLAGSSLELFMGGLPWFSLEIAKAVTIGVLLHISTTIIFESSEEHKLNTRKLLVILIGFLVAFATS